MDKLALWSWKQEMVLTGDAVQDVKLQIDATRTLGVSRKLASSVAVSTVLMYKNGLDWHEIRRNMILRPKFVKMGSELMTRKVDLRLSTEKNRTKMKQKRIMFHFLQMEILGLDALKEGRQVQF